MEHITSPQLKPIENKLPDNPKIYWLTRQTVYDAVEDCIIAVNNGLKVVQDNASDLQEFANKLAENEEEIIRNEDKRIANENDRINKDVVRENNEAARKAAELLRNTAEESRVNAENLRVEAENVRYAAEQAREEIINHQPFIDDDGYLNEYNIETHSYYRREDRYMRGGIEYPSMRVLNSMHLYVLPVANGSQFKVDGGHLTFKMKTIAV